MRESELDQLFKKSFDAQLSGRAGEIRHTYSGSYEGRKALDSGVSDWTGNLYGWRLDLECKVCPNKPTTTQVAFILGKLRQGCLAGMIAHYPPNNSFFLLYKEEHISSFSWRKKGEWVELIYDYSFDMLNLSPLRTWAKYHQWSKQ